MPENSAAANDSKEKKTFPPLSARCIYCGIFLAVITLIADQLSKAAAVHFLSSGSIVQVIPGFLDFKYAENTGAAWGILSGHSWLLLIIAGITVAAALRYLNVIAEGSVCRAVAVFLTLGGIAGNAIDRIWHGYVIDFIAADLQFYKWPIFNIADTAICIGVGLYILSTLISGIRKGKDAESDGHSN